MLVGCNAKLAVMLAAQTAFTSLRLQIQGADDLEAGSCSALSGLTKLRRLCITPDTQVTCSVFKTLKPFSDLQCYHSTVTLLQLVLQVSMQFFALHVPSCSTKGTSKRSSAVHPTTPN